MLSVYPACFFMEDGGYSVIFPDLNYLATEGETLSDALNNATECLASYLYKPLPDQIINPPSKLADVSLEKVAKELDSSIEDGSFVNLVSVDAEQYAKQHFDKAVKKTLTIPSWLNDAAVKRNINFSKLLKDALIDKLNLG